MAVPHSSESPCEACGSPTVKLAPGTATGKYMVAPLPMRQLSMLPPVWLGGMELAISTSAGATPMVPKCGRSEEHTSELQSHSDLVCRLLLEKKKNTE